MEEKKEQSTFEKDLAMLKFFQEEFLYRHKHYWDVLMKTFLVAVVVTVLPIVSEVLGVKLDDLPRQYLFFFPALGAAISLLSYDLLRRESDRLNRVGGFKNDLLQKLEERYRYQPVKGSGTKEGIAYYMMRVVLAVELFMALAVFLILLTNYGVSVPPAAGS